MTTTTPASAPAPAPAQAPESTVEIVRLSYSSTKQHRLCPAQWAFQRVEKIEKALYGDSGEDIPVERDFGSWWHALRAADAVVRGTAHGSLLRTPDEISLPEGRVPFSEVSTPEAVLQRMIDWWEHAAPAVRATWTERLGEAPAPRLRSMDENWRGQWASDLQHERPLAVELEWERELYAEEVIDPETGLVGGERRYVLVGYVDEVYRDERRGVVVVRDNKVHKSLNRFTRADELLDSQLSFYAWGAQPALTQMGAGRIQATAYDRVRMLAPKTPAVTKAGGLSKSVTDYDLSTYLWWCGTSPEYPGLKKDGSGAGIYQAEQSVIDRLSTPGARAEWFTRTLTPLSAHTVQAHLIAALDSARAMSATRERYQSTGVAGRNFGAACRWCDFAPLCHAHLVGGPEGTYDLEGMGLRKRP